MKLEHQTFEPGQPKVKEEEPTPSATPTRPVDDVIDIKKEEEEKEEKEREKGKTDSEIIKDLKAQLK